MKKRVLAILITIAMVAVLLPALPKTALAAETVVGDFTVESSKICAFADNVLTLSEAGDYTISGTSETQRIVVTGASTDVFNITMSALSITSDTCAFEIKGGATANITLATGTINTLTSGSVYSGLQKNSTSGTLTIGGSGELIAAGGADGGAGIGGGQAVTAAGIEIISANGVAGTGIIIAGGRITATGNGGGAGIGGSGGYGSTGGTGMLGGAGGVTITGGTITAVGGVDGGAGIGGGAGSEGIMGGGGGIGTVAFSGGTVMASSANGIGVGSGISVGVVSVGDDSSTITITGGSVKATMGSRPQSGTSDMYKTVLQFPLANTAVEDMKFNDNGYGCNDMATDGDKLVYVWLPLTGAFVSNNNISGFQDGSLFGASVIIMGDSDMPNVFSGPINYDTSWYVGHSSPYTISTALQLRGLSEIAAGTAYAQGGTKIAVDSFKYDTVTLANDITLSSIPFTPIGTEASPFWGSFDGGMHTVSNLTVSSADCAGFFGYNRGTVKNVGVSGSVSSVTDQRVGGIVGQNNGYIINCFNTAAVSSTRYESTHTGGVAGSNHAYIYNCYNTGAVSSEGDTSSSCGGVIGYNTGFAYNCYNTGDVTGGFYIGGAIGWCEGYAQNCYWRSGTADVGCKFFESDGSNFVDCAAFTSENGGTLVSSVGGTTSLLTALNAYATANQIDRGGLYRWAAGTGTYTYPVFDVVAAAPNITAQPQDASVAQGAAASFSVSATGNPNPLYQWQVSTNGIDWANVTTGFGRAAASYTTAATTMGMNGYKYRCVVTNGVGSDTSDAATLTVTAAPEITTASLPDGTVNTAYSQSLTATGAATITWSVTAGALPGGLTLSTEGVISGTPTVTGTFNFTVQAENSEGSDTQALSIVVNVEPEPIGTAPHITTTELTAGTLGEGYFTSLIASGTAPFGWGIIEGSLPDGLSLDDITGVISGTPTRAGIFNFTAMVENVAGSDTKALSITVGVPITGLPISQTVYNGGRFTLNLQPAGGILEYDKAFFSVVIESTGTLPIQNTTTSAAAFTTLRAGTSAAAYTAPDMATTTTAYTALDTATFIATFTALKSGTSTITYTAGGISQSMTVTIEASTLPKTGQDFTWAWLFAAIAALALAGGIVLESNQRRKKI